MDNNTIRKQAYDEVYFKLMELYKDDIKNCNTNSVICALGTTTLVLSGFFNFDNLVLSDVSFGAVIFVGIVGILNYLKKHSIIEGIKREANTVADNMMQVHLAVARSIGPIAEMLGVNFVGHIIIDDAGSFVVQDVGLPRENIIEAECKIIDNESMNDLIEAQNRAFALKGYIEDVAYDNYEEDLSIIEGLIMELTRCEDITRLPELNYEVNSLAEIAYNKALNLYGVGR